MTTVPQVVVIGYDHFGASGLRLRVTSDARQDDRGHALSGLAGPYDTVVKLLANLETAPPPLVINNLHVHGVLRRPGTPASAGLDAGLDVFGFRNNENPVAGKQ